jgi:hypothetical protein
MAKLDNAYDNLAEGRSEGYEKPSSTGRGITARFWYASPAAHVGYELIGAGMLLLAGDGCGLPFGYDGLERWTRRLRAGMRSRKGER